MATSPRGTTVRDLRRANRSRALWRAFLGGPLTRQEIAAHAGLSPATVSNLVAGLLAEGVIIEVGVEDSGGGRPRGLLRVNPDYGFVIGVDVGETAFLVELFDLGLTPRGQHRSATDMAVLDPHDAVRHVARGIESVIVQSGVPRRAIIGVGVAAPGLVEISEDAVVHGQSVGWDAVPVGAMLRARTGLPVLVDNGANTLGQAEHWFGAARGADHAVIVLLGIGAGGCIISDGEVYRGADGHAGEWGHTTVAVGGRRCRCEAAGCLEAYVGAAAIAARYAELRGSGRAMGFGGLEGTIAAIIESRDRDPAAAAVLGEAATYLGAGIGNLINMFNPTRVVVGGWLGRALCDAVLPAITAAAAGQALGLPLRRAEIVKAQLGSDAVALGGATLPIARLLAAGAAAGLGQTTAPVLSLR
jgi:predicted NBD/HSP70 family sugar kinase